MKHPVLRTLRRRHLANKGDRRFGFTLLELIVVLLVLGILAAIAVPTFNRVKENSVVRVAQTTLEAAARNGEAIAKSDGDATDEQIAASVESEFTDENGLEVTVSGDTVTVTQTKGSITASGSVQFNGGDATITDAVISGVGGGGGSSSTTTPSTTTAFSLSYAASAFSLSGESQALGATVNGGTAASFALTGTLPTGVSFNPTTGAFTGPTAWNFEAVQLDAGSYAVCARTVTGTVYCWGNNDDGELGDGTSTNTFVPTRMRNADGTVLSGVTDISVGQDHACAVLASSQVRCWGYNSRGQLGDGSQTTSSAGVSVLAVGQASGGTALSGISKVAAGGSHTCALRTSGGVVCWGYNDRGQLGNDTSSLNGATSQFSTSPVDVLAVGQTSGGTALSGITSISAGRSYTCGVTSAGGVVCWGSDSDGQLGKGAYAHSDIPVDVLAVGQTSGGTALSGVAGISAGYDHACAALTSEGAVCWGRGTSGKLGHGITSGSNVPVVVIAVGESSGGTPMNKVVEVSAGIDFSCARATSGEVRCWGGNSEGQLGNGTNTGSPSPVTVYAAAGGPSTLADVEHITTGYYFTCASLSSGVTTCWGENMDGAIGQDPSSVWNVNLPTAVASSGPNTGFPATVTVTATASDGRTADASVTLTLP